MVSKTSIGSIPSPGEFMKKFFGSTRTAQARRGGAPAPEPGSLGHGGSDQTPAAGL